MTHNLTENELRQLDACLDVVNKACARGDMESLRGGLKGALRTIHQLPQKNLAEKEQQQLDASLKQVNAARDRGDFDALVMGLRDANHVLNRLPAGVAIVEVDGDDMTPTPVTRH